MRRNLLKNVFAEVERLSANEITKGALALPRRPSPLLVIAAGTPGIEFRGAGEPRDGVPEESLSVRLL